jgi:hypothetical protein
MDMSEFIVAKSDQLNADDLLGGPIVVKITEVARNNAEQPVNVHIEGYRPWRPCKTSLRILVAAWGKDSTKWVGRWVRLFRDPTVKWGGEAVGGIRPNGLSHIKEPLTMALAVTKGTKRNHKIDVIEPPKPAELTREDCERWLKAKGKPTLEGRTSESLAELGGFLKAFPQHLDAIRSLIPTDVPE